MPNTEFSDAGKLTVTTARPDLRPDRPMAIEWGNYTAEVMAEWEALLGQDPEEAEVQEFLELHPSMVPGGSGDVGPGGHHGAELSACFRRPRLKGAGRDFEPDFMWVTRSTALITPVLVEIEKPTKCWFKKNGRPTAALTEALAQLNDWRTWFTNPENVSIFRRQFLFNDYANRPLEPQYVLVYGRRSEFQDAGGHEDPDALRSKRDGMRRPDESFMTFDALMPRYDSGNSLTVTMSPTGPRLHAFSPTYGTSAGVGRDARLLGDAEPALRRSVMMSLERKDYLAERWQHWTHEYDRVRSDKNSLHAYQGGYE